MHTSRQERLVTFSRKLHYLLANLSTGSARLLVRQNQGGNVFETWRLLHQRFSLPDASRHVSLLTKILDWKFNTHTFEQDFNAWETVKNKYEQQTGQQLPDSILVATLMNKTSGPLQQHLRLNAGISTRLIRSSNFSCSTSGQGTSSTSQTLRWM